MIIKMNTLLLLSVQVWSKINMRHRYDILRYLPERTVVRSLPESHIAWSWGEPDSINIEEHNIKTADLVSTFYKLQRDALDKIKEEFDREQDIDRRNKLIATKDKIRNMVFF